MKVLGSRIAYARYLESPQWKRIRKLKLAETSTCQDCGTSDRLEVHHLTYRHFGNEPLVDLQVLCHYCHMAEHGLPAHEVGRVAGPTVSQMTKALREREALERRQANILLAAHMTNTLEQFLGAFADATGSTRKKVLYIAKMWQYFIDRALEEGGLLSPEDAQRLMTAAA